MNLNTLNGKQRVVIENVQPEINHGQFAIKRIEGEKVKVSADIYADGHEQVQSYLLFRKKEEKYWQKNTMEFIVNDFWQGEFTVNEPGIYEYTIEAMVDHLTTWWKDIQKKATGSDNLTVDLKNGLSLLAEVVLKIEEADKKVAIQKLITLIQRGENQEEIIKLLKKELNKEFLKKYPLPNHITHYDKNLRVIVDRKRAGFSAWYELFPRSCSSKPGAHGTFRDCLNWIPEIANMGFNVLYFPPIHPIGETHRKGKNNTILANSDDPGSPWAIGNKTGGHIAIHPRLGRLEDFQEVIKKAQEYGMEIALDLAFQCSPDHPYIKEHPEWFRWRVDGTIQYAENPPKKYEDIVPFNFETENWRGLWEELKNIVMFWIKQGIKIFRVDNPHTKPFLFWEWLINLVKKDYPEVIFLSEAFTRPKVMYRLAKLGFTQSYTYFTWRNTKQELTDYLIELTQTQVREYFRPNFWPNTPDILSEYLQTDGNPAFIIKFILAATLSSNYGIYGPPYERFINKPLPGKEEYYNSEKYEIKNWLSEEVKENIRDLFATINRIREENSEFHQTNNIQFLPVENNQLLYFAKFNEERNNAILVVINLDPYYTQSGWVKVPLYELGIPPEQSFLAHDLLGGGQYVWQGEYNYVELNPYVLPAHIIKIKKYLKRENQFDYFN
ncbi:MAG: alpha-1,4-glucan--maltose-1-phosphate maltosyltransferase [Atribacterota bacterium]|nr:alpha-1,4-glucan--maltose-1-phosphate maltosyltransferase [Atribacterota bacterium]MDD4895702.1 alpha-1,4-glucan--maltose-1-phosphate maltosyltransferase [Atribacterota bacterium]MDD5636507.1 alpha-1,4-glucan--maltose-1-phosphate maltosyltransferase [Atribacterota bacterium]